MRRSGPAGYCVSNFRWPPERRRFAHASWLHGLPGIDRFPGDDTIRNFFLRFGMAEAQRYFEPMTEWMMSRIPPRAEGHSLDLDSTVFERHGEKQEGALKGYNPRRPGRVSHHPLLAVLAESRFVMHGWLRSGNTGIGRAVTEFLKEALAPWGARGVLRVMRSDSGQSRSSTVADFTAKAFIIHRR